MLSPCYNLRGWMDGQSKIQTCWRSNKKRSLVSFHSHCARIFAKFAEKDGFLNIPRQDCKTLVEQSRSNTTNTSQCSGEAS